MKMKTTQELKDRVKELSRIRTQYSRQGIELIKGGDRKAGHQMMKQAYETSRRCGVLLNELIRRQQQEI